MRYTMITGIGLSLILAGLPPAQASDLHAKKSHNAHLIRAKQKTVDPPIQQCDWIGPGGRAIYRCHSI
jgi:hypothetical protein